MPILSVSLFGKFSIKYGDVGLEGLEVQKAQELLAYLLLFRGRPHSREALAALLWGETSTAQSRKYLRKALWQLQTGLRVFVAAEPVLQVDQDWIRLKHCSRLWLDVAAFEEAFAAAGDTPGHQLDAGMAAAFERAVSLYEGDLLAGWYQDWCIYERERLQNIYLMILDKLIGYCEANGKYEAGLFYGATILKHDRARESTHRQVMRLQYLAGDRTSALRQYDRCVAALKEELDIKPDRRTGALYQRILADDLIETGSSPTYSPLLVPSRNATLPQLRNVLAHIQRQVSEAIRVIDSTLDGD